MRLIPCRLLAVFLLALLITGCAETVTKQELSTLRRVGIVSAIGDMMTIHRRGELFGSSKPVAIADWRLDEMTIGFLREALLEHDQAIELISLAPSPGLFATSGRGDAHRAMQAAAVDARLDAIVIAQKGFGGQPGDPGLEVQGVGVEYARGPFAPTPRFAAFSALEITVLHGPGLASKAERQSPWVRRPATQEQLAAAGLGSISVDEAANETPEASQMIRAVIAGLVRTSVRNGLKEMGFSVATPQTRR